MFFFAVLFLWFCTWAVLYSKYRLIINGHKLKGEIVGFMKPTNSAMKFAGYHYIVRFKYGGELLAAKSIQSKMGTLNAPPKNKKGKKCTIYFNPKYPEQVAIRGTYGMEVAAGILFGLGVLGIIIYFVS